MTADFVSDTSDSLEPARAPVRTRSRLDKRAVIGAIPIALVLAWVLFFATRHVGRLGRQRTRRVRRHPPRRADLGRAVLHRRLRVHADLRADAHGQHGPRRPVPARRLHRHRGAAADGRQGAQHHARGRRHAVVDRPPARRGVDRGGHRAGDVRGVPALEPGSGTAPGADHDGHRRDPRRPDARPRRRAWRSRCRGPAASPTSSRSSASATPPAGCSSSAIAIVVGALLWLWLNRTRMGIVIRAGVADQSMVRALWGSTSASCSP